jgi:leucine dehydrogenase
VHPARTTVSERYETVRVEVCPGATLFVVTERATSHRPANGGLRLRACDGDTGAVRVGRLLAERARIKHALHRTGFAGAALIAAADPRRVDRALLLRATAAVLDDLGGTLRTGRDAGATTEDVRHLATLSPHVLGGVSRRVDPARATARGVLGSVRAVVGDRLDGLSVLVHGTGAVGAEVAELLHAAGTEVRTHDLDPARAIRPGCRAVPPDEPWWRVPVDVVVVCSTEEVIDPGLAAVLRAGALVAAADAPFTGPEAERVLRSRGTVVVPDVVGGGGAAVCDSVEHYNTTAFHRADPEEVYAFVEDRVHGTTTDFLADPETVLDPGSPDQVTGEVCGQRFLGAGDVLRAVTG